MGGLKVKNKSYLLFLLIILLSYASNHRFEIQELFEKIPLEKQVNSLTKVVSADDLYLIDRSQRDLADKIEAERYRNNWLTQEILKGSRQVRFNRDFMLDHPQYDLAKIEFPVTKYIDKNGITIEFISDKGIITKVHSENGWEDFKNHKKLPE